MRIVVRHANNVLMVCGHLSFGTVNPSICSAVVIVWREASVLGGRDQQLFLASEPKQLRALDLCPS